MSVLKGHVPIRNAALGWDVDVMLDEQATQTSGDLGEVETGKVGFRSRGML